jgi:hypothetical protein
MKNKIIPTKLENALRLVNSLPKEELGSPEFNEIKKPPIEAQVFDLIETAFQQQVKEAKENVLDLINAEDNLSETEINELCEGGVFTPRNFPPLGPHPFFDFLKSLPRQSDGINYKFNKVIRCRSLFVNAFDEVGGGYHFNVDVENKINRIIDDWLSTLPEIIAEHLRSFEPFFSSKQKYLEISRRYQELLRARGQLFSLAETTMYRFTKENNYELKSYFYWVEPYLEPVQLQTEVQIEANGTARFQKGLFADAIDGVDTRRIRLCNVCEQLFWAKRLDQVFCSKACSGLKRIHRWREKSFVYEHNRITNGEKRARRASGNGSI